MSSNRKQKDPDRARGSAGMAGRSMETSAMAESNFDPQAYANNLERDEIATVAMLGLLARPTEFAHNASGIARDAYDMADAMIAEAKRRRPAAVMATEQRD